MLDLIESLGGADATLRTIGVAVLVAARIAPLTILAPWIALRATPPALRAALLLALTVAMTPLGLAVAPPLPPDVLSFAVAVVREGTIGTVFAIALAIPLHALEQGGRLVDTMRGASQSESTMPSGERSSPMGSLQMMLGATIFLTLGGHRLAIEALGDGLVAVPPGSPIDATRFAAFALGAVHIVVLALTLAVSFAAPAAVSLVAAEVALGLVGRSAPQIPMHFAGMPVRAAVGIAATLLGLSILLPHLAEIFADAIERASRLVSGI